MKRFTIGHVLGTSLGVWRKNFIPFTLIALLIYAPALVLRVLVPSDDWGLYMLPGGILLGTLVAAAVTYGVIMEIHGTRPSHRDCIATGFAQLLPVLGTMAVTLIAIVGGLILLVVPGMIVALMLYVVVPVAILEKPGVMASLKRSRELTEGHKGELFVILMIVWFGTYGLEQITKEIFAPEALKFVSVGLEAIAGVFGAVTAAVAYTILRHDRDGTQVPELATAFVRR